MAPLLAAPLLAAPLLAAPLLAAVSLAAVSLSAGMFTGDGFPLMPSGTAGTRPGTARGARRRCRWPMAGRG